MVLWGSCLPRKLRPVNSVMARVYLRECLSSIEVLGCSVNWLCERLVPDICSTQILLLPASEIHELQFTSAIQSRNEHTSWERIRTVNNAQIHFKLLNISACISLVAVSVLHWWITPSAASSCQLLVTL